MENERKNLATVDWWDWAWIDSIVIDVIVRFDAPEDESKGTEGKLSTPRDNASP
jgi:hypothetical protein